jgi:ketosteroid isomerase-like protein
MLDPKKQAPGQPGKSSSSDEHLAQNPSVDEFFTRLQSDMRHPLPSQQAIAEALQTMQRLAAEAAGDAPADSSARTRATPTVPCEACGHLNRPGSQFCGMCGVPLTMNAPGNKPSDASPGSAGSSEAASLPAGQHHYHHHYHHHYLAPGQEGIAGLPATAPAASVPAAKLRAPGGAQTMSRVEAAVRKVMQDWVQAANMRQLDDLISTYASDALVLRPNHAAVRGSAAIREFFFTALDAGLGEIEIEPQRVDVIADVAYEAGRCKMLVPVAVGKRREERGKYLAVLARQSNGEWKIVCDCWSTDLSLAKPADVEPKPTPTPPAPPRPTPTRKIT